jgi:D-alanyl-D-alanine carboxypeptidase (penicillin-binding protein 5/6)
MRDSSCPKRGPGRPPETAPLAAGPSARFALWLPALALAALLLGLAPAAQAYDTSAKAAILIDAQSGRILFEKNPDLPLPPASMSKLMTVYMLMDRLSNGTLTLDDTFPVSEKAWRKGGSKMFVEVGDRVRVEDLLHGILIASGNDACIVVAEALGGSEEAFAAQMTERSREIGMTSSTFKNASGWPDPEHLMSVRDLATLARILIEDFAEFYHIFAEKEFTYADIRQYSRNPLLRRDLGVDGLKTGYTNAAGYGLTASAIRDGRRLILVVAGLKRPKLRASESERLLEHGFREYKNYQLFTAGDAVEQADVWLGDSQAVPLVVDQDVVVSLTAEERGQLQVKLIYEGPIPAPVASGSELAHLEISAPGLETRRIALVAGGEVQAANLFGRVTSALGYLIWGPS